MCAAISTVGLEPEITTVTTEVPLRTLLYAYLRYGFPVILGVDVEGSGNHAIALAGFSLLKEELCHGNDVCKEEVATGRNSVPMIGRRIDELYGHDDQVGPFARLIVQPPDAEYPATFEGSWEKKGKKRRMLPTVAIVPVYGKIRVSFMRIYLSWLTRLHEVTKKLAVGDEEAQWDIHLITSNDYKEEIRTAGVPTDVSERLRLRTHPRFVWRVRLYLSGAAALELLADATDMPPSFPFYGLIWLNKPALQGLVASFSPRKLQEATIKRGLIKSLTHPFFAFLRDAVVEDAVYLSPKRAHRKVF